MTRTCTNNAEYDAPAIAPRAFGLHTTSLPGGRGRLASVDTALLLCVYLSKRGFNINR